MTKSQTQYVDLKSDGKAQAFDLLEFAKASGVKDVAKMLATYDMHRKAMNKALDDMLAAVETAAAARGLLAPDMALAPWFNYGHKQVVRVIGQRHGTPKAPKATDSVASVAALLASVTPQPTTRLIQRNGR